MFDSTYPRLQPAVSTSNENKNIFHGKLTLKPCRRYIKRCVIAANILSIVGVHSKARSSDVVIDKIKLYIDAKEH